MFLLTVDVCDSLEIPMNGSISSFAAIYASVVVAACDPGFMFPDGTLQRRLKCVADKYGMPIWNDSVSDCQGKRFSVS